ncbi:phage holin [Clostridium sp. SYSU_GA19001]|uniref:phage holin n=1 Tax=Clostridium caldaquaticum TaxID=2940653 RepID=UPI002076FC8A|nr:phage holin [Clostridium caldaquaticum]MCM8710554.1 phage holin [Clostridium caldaquaticum]
MDIKSRLRNKTFLVSLFSAVLLLCQQLGVNIFPDNAADIFNTILVILTILGVVIDPTTPGISD